MLSRRLGPLHVLEQLMYFRNLPKSQETFLPEQFPCDSQRKGAMLPKAIWTFYTC